MVLVGQWLTGKGGGPGCQVTAFIPPGVTNTAHSPLTHCQSVVPSSIWHKSSCLFEMNVALKLAHI